MSQYGFVPGTFIETVGGKTRPKGTFFIILAAVGILVLSIISGVIGTRSVKDQSCDCRKKSDAGWMGFSITYFILTIIGSIILAVLYFRGKTKVAGLAQGLF